MQLTQRKRKDTTVRSEEKIESAFAPIPGKPTRLFLLTRFSNFPFVLSFEPFLDLIVLIRFVLLLFVVLGDNYLGINIH